MSHVVLSLAAWARPSSSIQLQPERERANATILRSNPAYVEEPLLLTIKQAVRRMGVKDGQVRKLTREGHLAHVEIGSRVMIPRGAIEQFIADNTVQPCRGEIPAPAFGSAKSADAFTSAGPNSGRPGSKRGCAGRPSTRCEEEFGATCRHSRRGERFDRYDAGEMLGRPAVSHRISANAGCCCGPPFAARVGGYRRGNRDGSGSIRRPHGCGHQSPRGGSHRRRLKRWFRGRARRRPRLRCAGYGYRRQHRYTGRLLRHCRTQTDLRAR